jgi:aryl-alcohol dehydrogenase-like predicted oxidoreductase
VIFGARTLAQLEENLGAAELELPEKTVKALDDASAFPLGYPYEFIKNVDGRW